MSKVRGMKKHGMLLQGFLIEPYITYGEKRILGASQEAVDIFLKENIIRPKPHL